VASYQRGIIGGQRNGEIVLSAKIGDICASLAASKQLAYQAAKRRHSEGVA